MTNQSLAWKARYYQNKLRNLQLIDMREMYAYWEQRQLRELLKYLEVDAVFDIGANVGQYASMLRDQVGYEGLIFSFEPIPDVAAQAEAAARGDERWFVHASVIAEDSGTRTFNVMNSSQFSSLSTPLPSAESNVDRHNQIAHAIQVPSETLADALQRLRAQHGFKRPFLKLDTQGYDVRIIEASKHVAREFVGLQSELAISRLYDHSVDFRQALTFYESLGFTLSALVPNNAGHFPRLLEIDCIMLRTDLVR